MRRDRVAHVARLVLSSAACLGWSHWPVLGGSSWRFSYTRSGCLGSLKPGLVIFTTASVRAWLTSVTEFCGAIILTKREFPLICFLCRKREGTNNVASRLSVSGGDCLPQYRKD